MARSAGACVLEANRHRVSGHHAACVAGYLDALALDQEMGARSKFVILKNLGGAYLALSKADEADELERSEKRCDAAEAWAHALDIDEGEEDRGDLALECGKLFLEDGKLVEAAAMFQRSISLDGQTGRAAAQAHLQFGRTVKLIGAAQQSARGDGTARPVSRSRSRSSSRSSSQLLEPLSPMRSNASSRTLSFSRPGSPVSPASPGFRLNRVHSGNWVHHDPEASSAYT
ncbi:hypothetical protein M885DRAFT_504541 [Pelagophyceae sp. CCMP2097]|nr:hypothetical protein M885DRAFT_504541 [Pelagophyceae sp. CCMP2097]|mmetsp:Transcript_28327/g.95371  ORF Transcript_28327/g.95371 Transcript_28327/m.95371 type:complete len:230 (+) Transcript_28327:186-875(+)